VIAPRFKSGDFAGGVAAGVTRIIAVIDGEPLPAPAPEATHGQDFDDWIGFFNPLNPFFLVAAAAVGSILRRVFGRLIGSAATGGVIGVLAWYLLGSIAIAAILGSIISVVAFFFDGLMQASFNAGRGRGSGRGGGWSGGSYSGGGGGGWSSGSSSSDSDSGFSGGGGSFGGGGASGSW
jgi:uncharacterized protein